MLPMRWPFLLVPDLKVRRLNLFDVGLSSRKIEWGIGAPGRRSEETRKKKVLSLLGAASCLEAFLR